MRALLIPGLVLFVSCDSPYAEPKTPAEFFERAVSSYQDAQPGAARGYFVQAERMSREQGRQELLLQALVYQVRIAYELGEVHTAITKAQEAASLARQLGDFRAEAEVRTIEGRSLRLAGLLRQADKALRDALRIAETFQERPMVIEAHLAMGELWLASPDPAQALEHFTRALEGAQSIDQTILAARALHGLANVFLRQGKGQEAKNSITQALALLDRADDPGLTARTRLLQGSVLESEGNANAALSAYREAVNGLRRARTGRRLEVLSLFHIGRLYQTFQRSRDAKKYFNDGLEIARREGDKIAQYYLNVHLLLADISVMTPAQQIRISERIVQVYAQLASQFAGILQAPGEAAVRGRAGELLARAHQPGSPGHLAKAAEAERALHTAFLDPVLHVPYVTAFSPSSEGGRWSRVYASTLLESEQTVSALMALELGRLNDMAENLGGVDLMLRHPVVAAEAQEIRRNLTDLRLRGVELSAQLGQTRGADTLAAALRSYLADEDRLLERSSAIAGRHVNYAAILRSDSLGLADIRRHIPRGITVLEYIGDGTTVRLLALSRTDVLIRELAVPESTLHAMADEYVRLMLDPMVYSGEGGESSVPGMTRFAVLSTELYDLLVRPAESVIERGIIVVPNALLGPLPIHALERQEPDGRLEFVIERMSVDYLSSWTSVMFPTRSTGRMRSIVAFGNPTGKNWSVDYELRDIRSFYRNADVYTGRDASWENMMRTQPDLLQISSEFLPGLTSLGSFVVSEGEVTEGTQLVPFERMLELEAPPVVLLTNQTGGPFGLGPQHTLLLRMNGTSDVFLNRWIADRKAAKFFSEYFFTHLSGGLAPGDAYRQALLNLIQSREHEHPRSWAQFFHFGTG